MFRAGVQKALVLLNGHGVQTNDEDLAARCRGLWKEFKVASGDRLVALAQVVRRLSLEVFGENLLEKYEVPPADRMHCGRCNESEANAVRKDCAPCPNSRRVSRERIGGSGSFFSVGLSEVEEVEEEMKERKLAKLEKSLARLEKTIAGLPSTADTTDTEAIAELIRQLGAMPWLDSDAIPEKLPTDKSALLEILAKAIGDLSRAGQEISLSGGSEKFFNMFGASEDDKPDTGVSEKKKGQILLGKLDQDGVVAKTIKALESTGFIDLEQVVFGRREINPMQKTVDARAAQKPRSKRSWADKIWAERSEGDE